MEVIKLMVFDHLGQTNCSFLHGELLEYLRIHWGNTWVNEEDIIRDCRLSNGSISADQILYPLRVGNFYGIKFNGESQVQEMIKAIEVGLDEYITFIDNLKSHHVYHSFFKLIYLACLYIVIVNFYLWKCDKIKPLKILLFSVQEIKGISGLRVGLFLMSLESKRFLVKFNDFEKEHSIRALAISTIIGSYFHEMLKYTKDLLLVSEPEMDQENKEILSVISKNSDSEIVDEKDPKEFIVRSFTKLFISEGGIKNHYNLIVDLIE